MKNKITLENFLDILKNRIINNNLLDTNIEWYTIQSRLDETSLKSLFYMENTGGEPNIVDYIQENDKYVFMDTSKESPIGRRNVCYDQKALNERKKNKPLESAINLCKQNNIEILNKEDYMKLQTKGDFDLKTSSWILTPDYIRNLGGAIFCDKRYDTVFTYHNGAESYYSSRGFRAKVLI